MPLLYLREAEPFLSADPEKKMHDTMRSTKTKGGTTQSPDKNRQRQLAKRTTSLVISDAIIVIAEILQILALVQAMSLKWSYPPTWLKYANFIFIFNADAWEFIKVRSGAYTRVQGLETPSTDISVDYDHILIAWGIFLFFLGSVFITVFLILRHKQPPYLMVHYARLEKAFFFICQIIALPLGTVIFRLFHCPNDKMATNYSNKCLKDMYWAYFVPALVVMVFMFFIVPIWMAVRIRRQKLTATSYHHEDYMKLKEVEYMAGLDVVWVVQGYHLFSSFRLLAVYYRPLVFVVKLVLLIIFAAANEYIYNQAVVLSVFLSIIALVVLLIRPFRVLSFNVSLSWSLGCLAGDAIFGAMITSVTPATVESAWLVEPYSYWILIGINTLLVLGLMTWIVFMISVRFCCHPCYPNEPVWPVMTSYEYEVHGMETYKFMAAVLRGRAVLDTCIRSPSVFAPVHQLARQIEIINAFCREAEKTKDSTHATLLQLLDDMIDVFRRLEPVSLFSETVKEGIRQNASRFVEIMPSFCHRLAQRDYDLILVHPVRRRLLLKMYIVGMFINSKKNEQPVRDIVTQKSLHKLWEELPDIVESREEVEYREDLYPKPPMGPDLETMYMAGTIDRPLELMDLDDSDEEESLAMFLGRVPPVLIMKDEESRHGSRTSLVLKDVEMEGDGGSSHGVMETQQSSEVGEMLVDTSLPGVNTITVAEAEITSTHDSARNTPQPNDVTRDDAQAALMNSGFVDDRGEVGVHDETETDKTSTHNSARNSPEPTLTTDDPQAGFVNPAFAEDGNEGVDNNEPEAVVQVSNTQDNSYA